MIGAVLAVATLVAVGCDSGDGRTLRPPTAPPPTVTAPPEGPVTFPTVAPPDPSPDGSPAVDDTDDTDDTNGAAPDVTLPAADVFEVFAPWRDGGAIDDRHGCAGPDVSPALAWARTPDDAAELAISAIDETADGTVHWLVVGIDPAVTASPEGGIPAGAVVVANAFGELAWTGPCPAEGDEQTLRVAVHALGETIDPELLDETTPDELLAEIGRREVGLASTIGIARG